MSCVLRARVCVSALLHCGEMPKPALYNLLETPGHLCILPQCCRPHPTALLDPAAGKSAMAPMKTKAGGKSNIKKTSHVVKSLIITFTEINRRLQSNVNSRFVTIYKQGS